MNSKFFFLLKHHDRSILFEFGKVNSFHIKSILLGSKSFTIQYVNDYLRRTIWYTSKLDLVADVS